MLIYRHDMRSGLQWYVLVWTSFWIFLPPVSRSVGQHRLIEKLFFYEIQRKGIFPALMWQCYGKMSKSDVMNIFSYHLPRPGRVKSYHARGAQISWLGTTYHNLLLNVKKEYKNKSIPCVAKNATGQRRNCHAVVSSCAIKYFYFQNLARLINHVWIYGSNVAEGFSAFQRRSYSICCCYCCCYFVTRPAQDPLSTHHDPHPHAQFHLKSHQNICCYQLTPCAIYSCSPFTVKEVIICGW